MINSLNNIDIIALNASKHQDNLYFCTGIVFKNVHKTFMAYISFQELPDCSSVERTLSVIYCPTEVHESILISIFGHQNVHALNNQSIKLSSLLGKENFNSMSIENIIMLYDKKISTENLFNKMRIEADVDGIVCLASFDNSSLIKFEVPSC